ncbi:MAG TPA: alpha/beta hydrolase-fold protein [Vicinamibacterales bacterium]|jgi:predicted esterase
MGRQSTRFLKAVRVAALASCFQIGLMHEAVVLAQQPDAAAPPLAGRGGRGPIPVDPRVQNRTYLFAETNEQIPYAVFVSSKVRPDRKNPLIIALHGLGGSHTSLLRGNALDLAEEGGYILVGPMGYNPRGWYGVPATGRGGRGRAVVALNAPGAVPANPAGRQGPPPGAVAGANDPSNLRELSEKDVLNVLELVQKEFNVDEQRTYLMGHSMGGAGTFHLAVKYADTWAATASIAPAAFGLQPSSLSAIPGMPMMIVHGDADTAVPVTVGRSWAEAMKELNMTHQYIEVPGGDHGNVISIGMPDIFKFFASHSKPAPR